MSDVTAAPRGAVLGIMGWPWPWHGGTTWQRFLVAEGWTPDLALDGHLAAHEKAWADACAEARSVVLEQLHEEFPALARWAESVEWLQSCGRGDVVAVMSRVKGAILSHNCIAWREDYRDSSGVLWNWELVLASQDPIQPGHLLFLRADASGCVVAKRGEPTSKTLVRPAICGEELDGIVARWQATMGEALLGIPPVRTIAVEYEEVDWGAYERHMDSTLASVVSGETENGLLADIDALTRRRGR